MLFAHCFCSPVLPLIHPRWLKRVSKHCCVAGPSFQAVLLIDFITAEGLDPKKPEFYLLVSQGLLVPCIAVQSGLCPVLLAVQSYRLGAAMPVVSSQTFGFMLWH